LSEKADRVEKGSAKFRENVAKLQDFTLSINKKANTEGHLFSSVTTKEILQSLAKSNIFLEEKDLELFSPIKKTGRVTINLHNTETKLEINILPEK
jgi:ribosomal protein L9